MSIETLERHIADGTLIRHAWYGKDGSGRATACTLVALAPEVLDNTGNGDPSRCPATVMPEWMARLTPWMNDAGSEAVWPAMVRRYANLARRWHVLTPETWVRLDYECRRVAVREVRTHAADQKEVAAVDGVLALLDRAVAGDMPTSDEWRKAARAAWEAAEAAEAAAWEVAWAAAEAAAWAAEAAAWAAEAAAAGESKAATRAAAAWTADRVTTTMLDCIEAAIVAAEGGKA